MLKEITINELKDTIFNDMLSENLIIVSFKFNDAIEITNGNNTCLINKLNYSEYTQAKAKVLNLAIVCLSEYVIFNNDLSEVAFIKKQ